MSEGEGGRKRKKDCPIFLRNIPHVHNVIYSTDGLFNPLMTEVYFGHQNQKIKKERSSDKLSCGPIIFKIFPLLGAFHHFL
jgi:hypothetical protein